MHYLRYNKSHLVLLPLERFSYMPHNAFWGILLSSNNKSKKQKVNEVHKFVCVCSRSSLASWEREGKCCNLKCNHFILLLLLKIFRYYTLNI